MKKLMLFAAASVAMVGMADIVSANTVGYSTRTIPQGQFRLMGIPWETTDGGTSINKIMPYGTATYEIDWDMSAGDMVNDMMAKAPQLQLQRAGSATYDLYFWVKNAYWDNGTDDGLDMVGWCNESGTYADSTNPGIGEDPNGDAVPGVGAWFKDPQNASPAPQLSGQVVADDVAISCPESFRLRAPTLPLEINLNDATKVVFAGQDKTYEIDWDMSAGDMVNDMMAKAPQIQVQRVGSATYDLYFFVKNAYWDDGSDEGLDREGWCNEAGTYADPTNPGIGEDANGNIPVGAGMWTKGCKGAFTVTFKAL